MTKKRSTKGQLSTKQEFTLFILVLAILTVFSLLAPQFHPVPQGVNDFPNAEEGTFAGTTQKEYYKEDLGETIILFSSAKIPTLNIIYHPNENKLTAGSPHMEANNIVLFDGQHHEIAYTFKRNWQQTLYYDGQPVASSNYQTPSQLTGLVTGTLAPTVSKAFTTIEIK